MNYLDLTNRVLDRLREERATAATLDSNPYFRSIGAHINDAKEQVENAWQWSMLRQDDSLYTVVFQDNIELPDSADNNYTIHRITVRDGNGNTKNVLRWVSDDRVWRSNLSGNVQPQVPAWYSTGLQAASGNQTINIFPPTDGTYEIIVHNWHNQDPLTAATDILKVPSFPVYTLATALASRERGETGAINTGELFAIANAALSDAIAYDSARFPEEMDWSASHMLYNTNVKTA